jgi:hypothetical protein
MAGSNQGETVANAINYGGNRAFWLWVLSLSHSSPDGGPKTIAERDSSLTMHMSAILQI